jgi:hypothetical protein
MKWPGVASDCDAVSCLGPTAIRDYLKNRRLALHLIDSACKSLYYKELGGFTLGSVVVSVGVPYTPVAVLNIFRPKNEAQRAVIQVVMYRV